MWRENGSVNQVGTEFTQFFQQTWVNYNQMGREALEGLRVSPKPAASRKINKRIISHPVTQNIGEITTNESTRSFPFFPKSSQQIRQRDDMDFVLEVLFCWYVHCSNYYSGRFSADVFARCLVPQEHSKMVKYCETRDGSTVNPLLALPSHPPSCFPIQGSRIRLVRGLVKFFPAH